MITKIFYTIKFIILYIYNFRSETKKAILLKEYIENMGPVFIKLAQIASMHKYWFNQHQYFEISKLRDNVAIENDLTKLKLPDDLEIDKNRLSSGSIATVHLGKYKNENVVIKVKRRNIDNQINDTLFYIEYYFYFLKFMYVNCLNVYHKFLTFKKILLKQLDFDQEVKNLLLFKKFYSKLVKIPKVYPEVCTNDLIVMEYLPGIKTDEMLKQVNKEEKQKMNKILYGFLVTSINIKGLFHSDLHSGNFSWTKNDKNIELILYDFGLIGRFTPDRLLTLNKFYSNLIHKNVDKIICSVNEIIIDKSNILEKDNDLFNLELKLVLESKLKDKNIKIFR